MSASSRCATWVPFLFRCAWLIISILILFFNRMQPIGFVCVFYAIYCFNGLCQGITSLTYTQMMNKVIPNRVKGRFFGVRGALNSAAGIIGAQIGGAVIASSGDVRRFRLAVPDRFCTGYDFGRLPMRDGGARHPHGLGAACAFSSELLYRLRPTDEAGFQHCQLCCGDVPHHHRHVVLYLPDRAFQGGAGG